jgi:phosphate transport system substrate-binding protein
VKHTLRSRLATPAVAAATLALGLAACGASNEKSSGDSSGGTNSGSALSGTLNGAGSTAQQVAMETWKNGFQSAHDGVTINYDPSGSGAGVEQFLAGGVQFAGSDKYFDSTQMATAKDKCGGAYVEVPVYISRIGVIFNLNGVKSLNLTSDTVAAIFAGKITKWNDPAIAKTNSGVKLPSTAITPVHRSDDSGTTFNFTDYLAQIAKSTWGKPASETWPFKSGEGADGNSGVVAAVTKGQGTVGYADVSQAGQLGVAKVKVGSKFVAPSRGASAAVVEASKLVTGRPENDLAIAVNRTSSDASTYPIVLVSYQMACNSYSSSGTADLVKAFLTYEVSPAAQQAASKAAGSAPLSDALSTKAKTAIATIGSSS